MYTVFKEVDFGTSLEQGPHRDSNLAEAYRAARESGTAEYTRLEDFEPYAPSYGAQAAVIASVRKVTHIAPPDDHGNIIGETMQQPGVIHYDAGPLGLCMGLSDARFVTTTEVYPDSPRANPEQCNAAQIAAIVGALDFLLAR